MLVDTKIWDEYEKTKSREIRDQLILSHLKYVNYVVNDLMWKNPGGMTKDDLSQLGVIGLMEAVDRYDYRLGANFPSFAKFHIRGRIIDEMRKHNKLNLGPTRTMREKMKKIEDAIRYIENKEHRTATMEDVASYLGITMDEYYNILGQITSSSPLSLDKMIGVDDNLPAIEVIADEKAMNPEKEFVKKERIEKLTKEIEKLKLEEFRLITLRYYDELTFVEIAYQLGLTPGRISQMHTHILFTLRVRLEGGA